MEPVEKREYNTEQRRQMADEGKALPDGSFPIADKTDLGNALQSIGRAKNRSLALAHIRRRAKDLGAEDMLPEWAMGNMQKETGLSLADDMVLDSLRPMVDATDEQWSLLVQETVKAGGVKNLTGYAKDLLEKAAKQSFGGDRSAAGRYAAQARWARRGGGGGTSQAAGGKASDGERSMAVESMKDQMDADAEQAARMAPAAAPAKGWDGGAVIAAVPNPRHREAISRGNIDEIAQVVREDHRAQGKKVNPALAPYLDAMGSLQSVKDNYGADSGSSIVAYALSNMRSYAGATAKAVKLRLKGMLKG